MSTSTLGEPTPTRHRFEKLVEDNKPTKMDINSVIMDYLIKEGYPDSAKKFAMEANIRHLPASEESMDERVVIKKAIHAGQIQIAIEKINELDPDILDRDKSLHFALLRLQLIEIIRTCCASPSATVDVVPAVQFATEQLSSRASINKEWLHDLEQTMALLVFGPDPQMPQIAALLKPELKREVADKVNKAILQRKNPSVEAHLKEWVRARAWAEQEARKAKKDIPHRIPLGLDGDEESNEMNDSMNGNGEAEAMVT